MRGAGIRYFGAVPTGLVEITRHDSRSKTERSYRLDEQHSQIPAGARTIPQRRQRRLGSLVVTALVGNPMGNADIDVLQQGKRVGGITENEAPRPVPQCPAGIVIVRPNQRA